MNQQKNIGTEEELGASRVKSNERVFCIKRREFVSHGEGTIIPATLPMRLEINRLGWGKQHDYGKT